MAVDQNEAVRLYEAGASMSDVGRQLGVSKQRIHEILVHLGAMRRDARSQPKQAGPFGDPRLAERNRQIVQLTQAGLHVPDISARLGLEPWLVRAFLKRHFPDYPRRKYQRLRV